MKNEDCLIVILISVVALLFLIAFQLTPLRMTPSCWEDSVIVGVGDFEDGRWEEYRCGPSLDDYYEGDVR